MKTTIWMAFFAIAATCALAEVPPVLTTEPVAQKWGEEADDEVQRDGLLFWRDDCGALYIGDGETPGGKAVCVGLPEDLYSWTNDVSANGHALLWGGGWSQQAEGGSLLVRLGTNSWLRFVASDAGTLANLAVSDLDQADGTMRLTADTADPGAVLLVATNLLDPEAWQPATNGEVVAATDASTTWLITLLDTPFEVYRVRTSVTLEAGIHAERTIHANAGIEMGGEQWDAWPDIGAIATNAADAAVAPVAGDLADHAADTDNPHGVTAEQVGALPLDGGGVVEGNLHVKKNTYNSGRLSHGQNVTNSGPYSFAGGECVKATGQDAFATGYYTEATGFCTVATGGRTKATGSYAEAHGQLAHSTNGRAWVWNGPRSDSSPIYGSHGDGSWNINPAGGLSGAYVGETNLADHIAAAVAPVEERVGELETNKTYYCRWAYSNVSASEINWIPTNGWPSTDIDLRVYPSSCTNIVVGLRGGWEPTNRVHIAVTVTRGGTALPEGASPGGIQIGSRSVATFTTSSTRRRYDLTWVPEIRLWIMDTTSMVYMNSEFDSDGKGAGSTLPNDVFLPEFDGEESAPTLALAPSLSPSAGHLELLDSLDALDVPAADEPDEFEPAAEAVE